MAPGVLDFLAPWQEAQDARQGSIDSWMRKNIVFGPDHPRPGPFVPDDWQTDILFSMQHTPETCMEIWSQAGKSTLYNGALGWLGETGKSAMMAFPTEELRDRFLEEKFIPMLEDCPRLDSLIERTAKGEIDRKMLQRKRGSPIPLATSAGVGQFQQWPAEFVLADEVDKFKMLAESNDPLAILKGRGRAYREKARLIIASTPTTRDTSLIDAHYLASCQFRRHCVCPLCGDLTLLVFNPGQPDRLTCQCCEEMLPFDAQPEILPSGRWIAGKPGLVGERDGYHINQFWDSLTPWQAVLGDYNPEKPRDFYAQQLAIPASNLAEEPLGEQELDAIFQPVPPGMARGRQSDDGRCAAAKVWGVGLFPLVDS